MGRGGRLQNGRWRKQEGRGASEVLPRQKKGGGGGKGISHAEGGWTQTSFWVVSTRVYQFVK